MIPIPGVHDGYEPHEASVKRSGAPRRSVADTPPLLTRPGYIYPQIRTYLVPLNPWPNCMNIELYLTHERTEAELETEK